jgi:hypothetical protein
MRSRSIRICVITSYFVNHYANDTVPLIVHQTGRTSKLNQRKMANAICIVGTGGCYARDTLACQLQLEHRLRC